MSIVRVGLAETKNYSDGYDLIFGKKDDKTAEPKQEQLPEANQQTTAGEAKKDTPKK